MLQRPGACALMAARSEHPVDPASHDIWKRAVDKVITHDDAVFLVLYDRLHVLGKKIFFR